MKDLPKKLLLSLVALISLNLSAQPLYICTAADDDHFNWLLSMIGGIHQHDFDELQEIAVFDLGFTEQQKVELSHILKVKLYTVEMTHPDLLKHFLVRPGRYARGWYAWKPVVLKQALDLFPYVLYIDSGITVMRSLQPIFDHIEQEGYFLVTCMHSIKWMTPHYVIQKFNLHSPERNHILDDTAYGLSAGIQGLTRAVYDSYLLPMYELSKDLNNFVDDGTAPEGFGTARNDQTLFSICARLSNLTILNVPDYLKTRSGTTRFMRHDFFKLRFDRENRGPEPLQKQVRYAPGYVSSFAYKG